MKRANDFLLDLHPEEVQQKVVEVENDLTKRIETQKQQTLMLSPLER